MAVPEEPVLFMKASNTITGPFGKRFSAGDLISTGTPPGGGLGMKLPRFLKDGDVVELEIENLGNQKG